MPINEEIRDKEVRLIDADGSMLGVMTVKEAQRLADSRELDLVKIADNANPPVCKIMDFKKNMFEQAKKEKEAKKAQKVTTLKEVRISAKIDEHDFDFKAKNASKFLQDGNKVKVSIRFRGREMHYTSAGKEVMEKFANNLEEVGIIDKLPKLEGRTMTMIISPKK